MIGRTLIVALAVWMQAAAPVADRVVAAVRTAIAPALPFPDSDAFGSLPAQSNTEALWMVKPLQPGDTTIEVLANPLNELNQLKAARAMAQIESNIESAQRRAAAQYDRAVAEAKRTGKSQEVDGITLADEGIAGAKIDAESHLIIDILVNEPAYKFEINSSVQPDTARTLTIPGANVIAMPSNVYHDDRFGGDRYAEAETFVFLGRVTPQVTRRGDHVFEVSAAVTPGQASAVSSFALRLRGNEILLAEVLRKTNWNELLELLK